MKRSVNCLTPTKPACGASVFLVLAFRRLYQERWKKTKQRPDSKAIREILEKQIVGFDISESAIKLTALSLYLTAIELDPKPAPQSRSLGTTGDVMIGGILIRGRGSGVSGMVARRNKVSAREGERPAG